MYRIIKRFASLLMIIILILVQELPLLKQSGLSSKMLVHAESGTDIQVGQYIQFGSYCKEPIRWRAINKNSDGSIMIFSEKILCLKAFDANGDLNNGCGDSDRIEYGSNYWMNSNIREWLNSEEDKVSYIGLRPDDSHVWEGNNDYAEEPGFLANFTQAERDAIQPVTHKAILATVDSSVKDGGSEEHQYKFDIKAVIQNFDDSYYENVTDRVFLLDVKELNEYVFQRGYDYNRRPTAKAISNSEWQSGNLAAEKYWYYWLRSSYAVNSSDVRVVSSSGSVSDDYAYKGSNGIVPALNLKKGVYISSGNGSESDPYVIAGGSNYIYDSFDPGTQTELPYEKLQEVTDKASAVNAINAAVNVMSAEEKVSSAGIDFATLFSEEAIAQSASLMSSSNIINIKDTSINGLVSKAVETREAAISALGDSGIAYNRELNTDVKFKTSVDNNVIVTIDKTATSSKIDNIRIETPSVAVTVSSKALLSEVDGNLLEIRISQTETQAASLSPDNGYRRILIASAAANYHYFNMKAVPTIKTYTISFNRTNLAENIKVALPKATGDVAYQTVFTYDGKVMGGKYNPATDKVEIRTKNNGKYFVKENKIDFTDIKNKSKEMQDAIKLLASKGILEGTTKDLFSPDDSITRAEIASYLLNAFSMLDINATAGYKDVKRTDWYYAAAGSAKKYGIFGGFEDNTFRGYLVIPKDQLVAVAARTLRKEMRYKDPTNIQKYLYDYVDHDSIYTWAAIDIAYATREALVIKRADSKFIPTMSMTRGDAAIILKRLYDRIW